VDSSGTDSSDGLNKYQPRWSLPARVLGTKDGQLKCVEIGTNRVRDALTAQCKLLPPDVHPTLQKINLEHIQQNLPRKPKSNLGLNPCEVAELRERLGFQCDCVTDTKSRVYFVLIHGVKGVYSVKGTLW